MIDDSPDLDDSPELDDWVRARFGVQLRTESSTVGWELPDLVGVALRRNPRRAHLLVSTVLGKHIPADPRVVRDVGRLLGAVVAQQEFSGRIAVSADGLAAAAHELVAGRPEMLRQLFAGVVAVGPALGVFGFAETATGLGHCVAEALGASWYLHSTRRQVFGVEVTAGFEEGHSHATSHLVQPLPPSLLRGAEDVVLVDDELTTGRTAMNAIAALHRISARSKYVIATLVDLRTSSNRSAMTAFAAQLSCEISVVALVSGGVELATDLTEAAAAYIGDRPELGRLPGPGLEAGAGRFDGARVDIAWPRALPEGGRHGFLNSDVAEFDRAVIVAADQVMAALPTAARRVLVVGTEELMYLPLRLAELIADTPGFEARFQTTTRSPVHPEPVPGYPVLRGFSFAGPEGGGELRYIYNLDWRSAAGQAGGGEYPDALVVIIDEAADRADLYSTHGLLAALGALQIPITLAVVSGCDPAAVRAAR